MPTTLKKLWKFVEDIKSAEARLNVLKKAESSEEGIQARGQESAAVERAESSEEGVQARGQELAAVERDGAAERAGVGGVGGGTDATGALDTRSREEVETVLKRTLAVVLPSANGGQESVQDAPYTVIDKSFVHFFSKTCDLLKTFSPNEGIPLFIPWFVQSIEPRRSWMRLVYELILDKFNLYEGKFDSIAFLESKNGLPANFDLSSPRKLVIVDCLDVPERNRRLLDSSVSLVGFSRIDRANLQSELPKNACSFTPFRNCYWSDKLLLTREAFKHLVKLSEDYRESKKYTVDDLFEYFGGTGNLDCLVFPLEGSFVSVHREVVHQLEPRMRPAIEMLNDFVDKVRFCNMKVGSIPDDFGAWLILSRPFEEDLVHSSRPANQNDQVSTSQAHLNSQDHSEIESRSSLAPLPVAQPASTESAAMAIGDSELETPGTDLTTSLQNLRPKCLPAPKRSVLAVSQDHQSENILAVSDLCFPSIFAISSGQDVFKRLMFNPTQSGVIKTIGGQFVVTNACKVFYALVEAHRLANQLKELSERQRRWHLTGIFGTGKTTVLLICACAWLLQPEKYRVVHIVSPLFRYYGDKSYYEQMRLYFTFAFYGDSIVSQILNANFQSPDIYELIDEYLAENNLILVVIIDQLNEVNSTYHKDLYDWSVFVDKELAKYRNIFLITAASMNNEYRTMVKATRIDILNGFNEKEAKVVEKMFDSSGSQTTFAIKNLGYRPIDLNFRVMGTNLQKPNMDAPSDLSREQVLKRLAQISDATYNAIQDFINKSSSDLHKMEPVSIIANFESGNYEETTLLDAIDRRYMAHVYIPKPHSYWDQFKIDSLYKYEKLLSQADFRKNMASSDLVSTILPCNKIVWSAAFQIYSKHLLKKEANMTKFYDLDRTGKGRSLESLFFFEMQTRLLDESSKGSNKGKALKGYDIKAINQDNRISIEKGAAAVSKIEPLGPVIGVNSPICVKLMKTELEALTVPERLENNGLKDGRSYIIQCNPFQTAVDFVIVLGTRETFLVQVGFLTDSKEAMKKMLKAAVQCHRDRAIMFPVLYQGVATPTINFVFLCTIDPFTRMNGRNTSGMQLQADGSVRYKPKTGSKQHEWLKYIEQHQNELKISLMFVEDNDDILLHTSGLKALVMGSESIRTSQVELSSSSDDDDDGLDSSNDDDDSYSEEGEYQTASGVVDHSGPVQPVLQSGSGMQGLPEETNHGAGQPSLGIKRCASAPPASSAKSTRFDEQ